MKFSTLKRIFPALLIFSMVGGGLSGCSFWGNWPIESRNSSHPIGNSGGEFQQYGGNPYFHKGIDIVDDDPAPNGPYVRTKSSGTVVTLALPGAGSTQNGLTLSLGDYDNSRELYWHLDFNSIKQAVRDADTNGTVLPSNSRVAQLHFWPDCDYHHLHFETCDDNGCTDPVLDLWPRRDTNGPFLTGLDFTDNGSNTVFASAFPDTTVNGYVDIIARAGDRQFVTSTQNHKTGVLRIRYQVVSLGSGSVVKTGSTIDFSNIPPNNIASVLFRNAAPFDSTSNYCTGEDYYYVVTNVDDANASNFAEAFAWDTTAHPNGRYRVEVTVWDAWNNTTSIFKQVKINN